MVDYRVERFEHNRDLGSVEYRRGFDEGLDDCGVLFLPWSAGVLTDLSNEPPSSDAVSRLAALLEPIEPFLAVFGVGHVELGRTHREKLDAGLLAGLAHSVEVEVLPVVGLDRVKAELLYLANGVAEVHASEEAGDRYTYSHGFIIPFSQSEIARLKRTVIIAHADKKCNSF